jgi:mRNA interferase MazF
VVAIVRRGEIWVGNLNPTRGTEAGKVRPVLILQADALSEAGARTVVTLPLSSRSSDGNPVHVPLRARDRLLQDSIILAEQPRTLDRNRIGDGPLTRLSAKEMELVEKALLAVLGIY